jgi:hypothetical protein
MDRSSNAPLDPLQKAVLSVVLGGIACVMAAVAMLARFSAINQVIK